MVIDTTIIVQICGIITSVAAAATILYKVFKSLVNKAVENAIAENTKKVTKAIQDQTDEISNRLDQHIEESEKHIELISTTMMREARDRINQAYNYHMRKQTIDAHSLYILDELFESYSELGGNHFTEDQMKELHELYNKVTVSE